MFRSGITIRWLLTTILVISLILSFFAAAVLLFLSSYYYSSVEEKLDSLGQSSALADFFSPYIGSNDDVFASRAHEYVENFNEINVAEVWVYDRNGEVIVSSTGFTVEEEIHEDYQIALSSPSGRGMWRGKLSSGERIMALSVLLPRVNGESSGAVRYIISLQGIDSQLSKITVMVILGCLFALLLVIFSGLFFVRSIVVPVKKLNVAARRIAKGNYSEKVEIASNKSDEITQLAESINYMINEIDKTDRMKNEFISTVSHELRTPLTAIKGWTETLLCINESSDSTVNDGLKVILSETERLYSLVEDLLDFSKMESGRLKLRLQKIDVLAELDEAVFMLRDRISREGIEFFYSVPDYPAPMNGDPDRIKQVFVNIIDNAVKYTPAGGKLSIVALLSAKELKISIADTGCGISAEDLPKVKQKFYKANLSVKGSGIGLAVCDEIINLHNGKLDIISTLGEGTEAVITLPIVSVNLTDGKEK